jgi:hypothetical protein
VRAVVSVDPDRVARLAPPDTGAHRQLVTQDASAPGVAAVSGTTGDGEAALAGAEAGHGVVHLSG